MSHAPLKMLVVDDEPDVELLFRQRFRDEIRQGQIELDFVLSGEECLSRLSASGGTDIVLILSDINMPGMTGLELLRILKARETASRVYMITAYSDERNYRTAIDCGADDYLTKPIDFAELKRKIGALK